jgi:hypothetical protein
MLYEIKSRLAGRACTLFVVGAAAAVAELKNLSMRGHQDVIVRDRRGTVIDPVDLRALCDWEQ